MATAIDNMTYDQLLAIIGQNRHPDSGGYLPYVNSLPGLTVSNNFNDRGDPYMQLHNPETETGAGGQGWQLYRNEDGSIGRSPYTYDSEWGMLAPLALATIPFWAPALGGMLGAGEAAGVAGTSGASGAAGAGAAGAGAAGYAIPTAAELSAAGFGTGGMGLTGAGGIGAASSVAGAGAGAAGYGAGALGAGLGAAAGDLVLDYGGMGLTGEGGIGAASSVAEAGAGAAGYGAGGGGLLSTLGNAASTVGKALSNPITGRLASGLLGGLAGAAGGSSKAGDQTITTRQEIDPRMASILYGPNGNDGFLSRILGQADTAQRPGMASFGTGIDSYLNDWGTNNFMSSQQAAQRLQGSNIRPPEMEAARIDPTAAMRSAQIQAPSQNATNLAPAYQDMVYGQPGANPFLTGAIQRGINQSTNAFNDQLSGVTRNLTENVLPSIRSGARVSGSYGGNREALAQGKALDTFNTQMGQALQRFGQGNTDAAVAAQAGAYDTDRSRALAAMSGLGAQQYGVASQQAGLDQQANMANYQGDLQRAMREAEFRMQKDQTNINAVLDTNRLNSANQLSGINASSGLLGQAYNIGQNTDAYDLNKVGKVSGLLQPYTGLGGSTTQTQPLYENKVGGALSGAAAGLGLWNMANNSGGGLSNWFNNNQDWMKNSGLGWSDLAGAF